MLDRLLGRLRSQPTPDPLEDDDSRLALGALMVRLARVDHSYDPVEKTLISELLQKRYALSIADADTLRQGAEEIEAKTGDTVHLTRLIKIAVPFEDRIALITDLWAITLVDSRRDDQENGFLRLVAKLIGVNDRDSALARQSAISN